MSYYLGVHGVQSGPVSEAAIREKLMRGELPAGALCWTEGWSDWRLVSQVFPGVGVIVPPPMPGGGAAQYQGFSGQGYAGPTQTSGLAIASLVTGVLGLVLFIPSVVAVICGHIACSKIKDSAGRITGRGMAITGMVLGYLVVAMMPVGMLAAMAIPAFQKVRIASQEKAIQNNLRQLDAAAEMFMLQSNKTVASYSDLVGPENDKLIKALNPVSGEDYTRLRIRKTDSSIEVTTADGRVIKLQRLHVSNQASF